MARASTRAAAAARRAGVEERVAVGAVEEHRRAVVADGAPRLDEEMRPLGIVRIGPEPGRRGHRGAGQREVALRRGRHGPQFVAPGRRVQRRAPRRRAGGEVGRREVAAPQLQEAPAELPLVEAVPAVSCDGAQRAGDAGHAHGLADVEGALRAELAGAGEGVDEMAGQRQHDGGGEPLGSQFDRWRQHLVERQPPVALVQGEPAVDGAGHLHAADVAPHGHRRHPLGAQPGRVGPGTGPADGEQRLGRDAGRRDHGEHVAPEPAQVRAHDGHRRPGGHGGVGRRAAPGQHADARRRGQLVGGRHHAAQPGPRSEGSEGERHASGIA